ncbi:hypothetical protein [Streptococcus thoraltensis]|uniref:hypothetical protein n=1 Tax=Streptococcus thoraltensis TaxID=55085 RepID=UPI001F58DE9A|nr:hypothetical protein [Streptococcus thoraltensis]
MAKVLKTFKDISTGLIYPIGDDYKGERLKEFQELGYVEKDAPKKTRKKADKESE